MELITTHTHTCFTNHGEGTVEELVSAAVAAVGVPPPPGSPGPIR